MPPKHKAQVDALPQPIAAPTEWEAQSLLIKYAYDIAMSLRRIADSLEYDNALSAHKR